MSVTLRDANGSSADRRWIQAIYPEYLHELGSLAHSQTGVFPMLGEHGPREPELLARWFRDERSHPLLILEAGHPVGFALVSRPLFRSGLRKPGQPGEFRMAEFFIRSVNRRRGIGRMAASLIFGRFAGEWEVSELVSNREAVAFWRHTIMKFTQGRYEERVRDGEVRQRFVTPTPPGSRPA